MGLIDPGIMLRQDPNALTQGAGQTMGLMAKMQEMRQNSVQQRRTEAARQAFAQAAQGEDITQPEGMKRTIQKFAQAGYPQEASAVFEAHKDMFAPPKTGGWKDLSGAASPTLYNDLTGETRATGVPGKPEKPVEPKNPDTKVGRDGFYYNWNQSANRWDKTNLQAPKDEQGPKGGLTDSQTATILNNIAHRMDNDKDLGILQRRDNFYTTAKTAWDEYQGAPAEAKDEARRQADQQIIFSLAKMRDEGVVMPGEFARETAGQGWINGAINAVVSGATSGLNLSDTQRKFAVDLMSKFRDQAKTRAKPKYEFYKRQGKKYGDPDYATGQWSNYFEDSTGAGAPSAAPQQPSAAEPKSKAEFDALPSGAVWKDSRGGVHKKK